jgi:hypothetical protein
LELETNELLVSLKVPAKNCQGKVAADTSNILGTPAGTCELKSQPINHMLAMVSKGLKMLQTIPIDVCLYLTKTSLQAKK